MSTEQLQTVNVSNKRKGRLPSGDFTFFGFSGSDSFLRHKLPERLGTEPRILEYGSGVADRLFFYTSYGDVAETGEAIVIKLGLLHSVSGEPITAQQLIGVGLRSIGD